MDLVNRFRYLVIQIHPTHAEVVAEHTTLAEAEADAALRDMTNEESGTWFLADEPATEHDHARSH